MSRSISPLCCIHTDAVTNDEWRTPLDKYLPLNLFAKFERVVWGSTVRGSWRPNRNCNILTPTLMAVNVVSFSFSRAAQPEDGWSATSYQQLLCTPTQSEAPSPFGLVWLSLPHLVYNSVRSLTATLLTSVLTELYNSSTPTQSPTRSLKSDVWSSSSGNNCHAVHRSLSSGASVYECTMGIFLPHPISSANFRPHDFLS